MYEDVEITEFKVFRRIRDTLANGTPVIISLCRAVDDEVYQAVTRTGEKDGRIVRVEYMSAARYAERYPIE